MFSYLSNTLFYNNTTTDTTIEKPLQQSNSNHTTKSGGTKIKESSTAEKPIPNPRNHALKSKTHNIELPKLPTNIFIDYDPNQFNHNLMFPMDDLNNPPVTFVSQSADVSRIGITSLFQDSSGDFDAIPSQELVDSSARIRVENSLRDSDRSRSPSPIYGCQQDSDFSSSKSHTGPMGTIEARLKLELLKSKYCNATKLRKSKNLLCANNSHESVMSIYEKIWNELDRRSSMGLNYLIYFMYEDDHCIDQLINLLLSDSLHVSSLPCNGPEIVRLYIAYNPFEKSFIQVATRQISKIQQESIIYGKSL